MVRAVGDIRDYASEEDIVWLAQKVHHIGAWDFVITREEFTLYCQRHGKDVEGEETILAVGDLYRRKYSAIAGGLSEQAWWDSEDFPRFRFDRQLRFAKSSEQCGEASRLHVW